MAAKPLSVKCLESACHARLLDEEALQNDHLKKTMQQLARVHSQGPEDETETPRNSEKDSFKGGCRGIRGFVESILCVGVL